MSCSMQGGRKALEDGFTGNHFYQSIKSLFYRPKKATVAIVRPKLFY